MDRRNKHLSSEKRGVIFAEHDRGSSQRAIDRLPGRSASTMCRELALDWVRDGLLAGGMLREVEVTAAMPKSPIQNGVNDFRLLQGDGSCA